MVAFCRTWQLDKPPMLGKVKYQKFNASLVRSISAHPYVYLIFLPNITIFQDSFQHLAPHGTSFQVKTVHRRRQIPLIF